MADCTYSPEVVDQDVENTQNEDQKSGAELGLETNDNHDTGEETDQGDDNSPERPVTAPDKANEQEDEQNTTGQLKVHLAVLFVNGRQSSKSLGLSNPRIGEHHQKSTNDGQVSQEEVEVEDETVAESLNDHDAHEAGNRIVGVAAGNDEEGTRNHGDNVSEEEDVVQTGRDYCGISCLRKLTRKLVNLQCL